MSVVAIVRVSFQSSVLATQAVNKALVGHQTSREGDGPFRRLGTAAYASFDREQDEVDAALNALWEAIQGHRSELDSFSMTYVRDR